MSSGSGAQHGQGWRERGGTHVAHRCVVLVGRGRPFPEALLAALARRDTEYHVVSNPAGVMVNLAVGPVGAVIINEPEQIAGVEEMLAAIARYFPRTGCWRFERVGEGKSRLTKIPGKEGATRIKASEPRVVVGAGGAGPGARSGAGRVGSLVGGGDAVAGTIGLSPQRQGSCQVSREESFPAGPLVTQDELAMLIGPQFGDGSEEEEDENNLGRHTRA